MSVAVAVETFHASAPRRPYCSDDPKSGQYALAHAQAIQRRHVQPNTPGKVVWLAFDVDMPEACFRWEAVNAAPPTLAMGNPANGHAHLAYGLRAPVPRTDVSRVKPLRYLAAVQEGTRRKLGADPGYAGGLIKTPGHPAWRTLSFAGLYGLDDLAEWCDLPSPQEMRQKAANSDYAGLGRNCTLFEHLRKKAYSSVRQFWRPGGFDAFFESTRAIAEGMNTAFYNAPLPAAEVRAIARSVSKWVWQRFDPTTFRSIQAARGARKGLARRSALLPDVLRLIGEGKTQTEVAAAVGIAQQTVSEWVRLPEAISDNSGFPGFPTRSKE